MAKTIRLSHELQADSIVDGEGIRAIVWTQGCSHNCEGCHNQETHSFDGGFIKNIDDLKKEIANLKNHDGITFSGGDPMFQVRPILELAKYAKELGLNTWCYTGFTFEQLLTMTKRNKSLLELLNNIDVLVDGRFVLSEKSMDILFRGSKNQRIIDVKKSLKQNKAIEIKKYKIHKDIVYHKECVFV